MKLDSYIKLPLDLQYQTIWEIGRHIGMAEQGNILYLLYAIDDFYVELQYSRRNNAFIGKMQFKQSDALDKYLPETDTLF